MYTVVATIGTGFAVRMRFWPLLFYWDLTICQDVHFYGTIVRGTKTLKDIDLECAESMWEQALIYKMTEGSHLFQHTTEQFLSSWYCLFFIWEQVRTNALRPSHHRYLKIKRLWCMNSVVVKVQLKEQFFFWGGGQYLTAHSTGQNHYLKYENVIEFLYFCLFVCVLLRQSPLVASFRWYQIATNCFKGIIIVWSCKHCFLVSIATLQLLYCKLYHYYHQSLLNFISDRIL